MDVETRRQAFVLRISPSGHDRTEEAMAKNQLIIGWSGLSQLLDPALAWAEFRQIVHDAYYEEEQDMRRAGNAAGHLWRFIRDMRDDDLVVVPLGQEFLVGRVTGPAVHDDSRVDDDAAFRRPVEWLNSKRPIKRSQARAALQSRMKSQGTSASASDIIDEITECLERAAAGKVSTVSDDLRGRLIENTLIELRQGRLDSYGFERLVASLLLSMGASEAKIVARSQDKGADIIVTFPLSGLFQVRFAVQVKHFGPVPLIGVDVVDQLIRGCKAESLDLGVVITSGVFSEDARRAAEQAYEKTGIKVELVDGDTLAAQIVDSGLSGLTRH
jgi:predicted Mrr-cat superfamily restriction endonuclease